MSASPRIYAKPARTLIGITSKMDTATSYADQPRTVPASIVWRISRKQRTRLRSSKFRGSKMITDNSKQFVDNLSKEHDYQQLLRFFSKYAIGDMTIPSCLVCGELARNAAVYHAEVAGIVVCHRCKNAADRAKANALSADERRT